MKLQAESPSFKEQDKNFFPFFQALFHLIKHRDTHEASKNLHKHPRPHPTSGGEK
jgi:hypothetical protein